MRYFFTLFLCITLLCTARAQQKYLPALKKRLDSILHEDQKFREYFANGIDKAKRDSLIIVYQLDSTNFFNGLNKLMIEADTSNTRLIQQIMLKYGYPGKTLVGKESSSVAWSVLQHSNQIASYLTLVQEAARKGEVEKKYAALMEDRVLMYSGKPQIYGTQGSYRKLKNGKSEMIIFPIQDPAGVNKRRRKMGFDTTVEANAKSLGITYREIKMEELL
ncbi:DUF6624 domain-containing protein [Pedobacter duraquae]|uniref:DUF4919 domain-containing protein n=1 Tax=Pedobacter duraquae TaxID=425511 RepID=A0A4R6IEG6_9SPHI|nr:DUF6624 domain-containing protein [Pedobacter duraquae]TDO19305.1 hypothetical protein CLV32_4545 [Pedobacter duraquae]